MPRVLLFASVAQSAGVREIELAGDTVEQVLVSVAERFGPEVAGQLEHCTVWVNGERAAPEHAVGEADEVAVLPPVSGGQC